MKQKVLLGEFGEWTVAFELSRSDALRKVPRAHSQGMLVADG